MRPKVILDGLKDIRPGEELSAKQIIEWIVAALDVTTEIPDFTVNSTGGVSRSFLQHLQKKTAKVVFPFHSNVYTSNMRRVVDAVGRLFETTIEKGNSLKCWIQIGQFLNDLRTHCTNSLFMVVSAMISVSLLKKMVTVPGFDKNKEIIDSMLLCYKCGIDMAKIRDNHKKLKRMTLTQYFNCCDEFLELIRDNLIFSSDAFFRLTEQHLKNGIVFADTSTLKKYLDAMYFPLRSNDQVAKTNIAMFLSRPEIKETFHILMRMKKPAYLQNLVLHVQKEMLIYFRDANITYDIDWGTVFACTNFQSGALNLFLSHGINQDEDIAERIVEIYLRYNEIAVTIPGHLSEEDAVKKFIHLIKDQVDFVVCDKLFLLLRKYAADSQAKCAAMAVIISFIHHAAKILHGPDGPHGHFAESYSTLLQTVYEHISYVEPHPELLCRMLNILFKISEPRQDAAFRQEITSIVTKAFGQCVRYGTAFDLLDILKTLDFNDEKLVELFESVLVKTTSDDVQANESIVQLMALSDVFDIFKEIDLNDRTLVFIYFEHKLNFTDGDEKVLWASLMMRMLVSVHSTPERFPGEAWDKTEREAMKVHRFLCDAIKAVHKCYSLASVHLGMAVCVYSTTFKLEIGVDIPISLDALVVISSAYQLSYKSDAEMKAERNDLRLIKQFWCFAIAVFKRHVPDGIIPSVVFEFYPRMEIHLINQTEEFLKTILDYDHPADQYNLFASSLYYLVNDVTKKTLDSVNKLFEFVAKTRSEVHVNLIAAMTCLRLLNLVCKDFPRQKMLRDIQKFLYTNKINKEDDRKMIMANVAARMEVRECADQECLKDLQDCLQKNHANPTQENEVPNEDMDVDEEPDEDEVPESQSQSQREPDVIREVNMSLI